MKTASDYLKSGFLKQEDLADGEIHVTITELDEATYEAKNGRPAECKLQLKLSNEKAWNLNDTNLKRLIKAFGNDTGRWVGQPITVYWDDEIQFQGRATGGFRVRVPKATSLLPEEDPDSGDLTE